MSDHLADEIERMNTRWMPLVAERLWLCSQADSQVALRRRVIKLLTCINFMSDTLPLLSCDLIWVCLVHTNGISVSLPGCFISFEI